MITRNTYVAKMDHIVSMSGNWYHSRCIKAHSLVHALWPVLKK